MNLTVLNSCVTYTMSVIRTAGLRSVLVSVICWLSVASGHENQAFHLAGASFCVDPASVQVVLELPGPQPTTSTQKALKRDLSKMLETALSRSQVSYQVLNSCADARDYTLLVADVRYLDPETYVGFGKQAYK